MDPERLTDFMDKLIAATRQGRVNWESEGPASFLVALPSGSVRIRSVDGDGVFPFEFTVFNEDGVSLETLRTSMGRSTSGGTVPRQTAANASLDGLYDAARDRALNIDGLIQGLLRDIETGTEGRPAKTPPPPTNSTPVDDDIPF